MSNELETQIEEDLLKDKITRIYKKYKLLIISIFFLLILAPIIFQFKVYYEKKKNEDFTALYLKAELEIVDNKNSSIEILRYLYQNGNDAIKILSLTKLIEIFLEDNDKDAALNELKKSNLIFKDKVFSELLKIQEALLLFDNIKEAELLKLLKSEQNNFQSLKNKILYDFYIKNNQLKKARDYLNK